MVLKKELRFPEASGHFRGERKPGFYFDAGCGRDVTLKDGIRKAGILAYPCPKRLKVMDVVQAVHDLEFDECAHQGGQLGNEFSQIDGVVEMTGAGYVQDVKVMLVEVMYRLFGQEHGVSMIHGCLFS